MPVDIKLSKPQIKKMVQSGVFLGRLLGKFLPKLIKPATKLIKPATSLLTNVGLPLGLSPADAFIQKKIFTRSGTKTLKIDNKELNDPMKIVQALEDHSILNKGVTNKVKNEVRQQRGGFLGMLASALGASLLSNLLLEQGMHRAGSKGQGMFRAGQGIKKDH